VEVEGDCARAVPLGESPLIVVALLLLLLTGHFWPGLGLSSACEEDQRGSPQRSFLPLPPPTFCRP